jgi:hypothetical protein
MENILTGLGFLFLLAFLGTAFWLFASKGSKAEVPVENKVANPVKAVAKAPAKKTVTTGRVSAKKVAEKKAAKKTAKAPAKKKVAVKKVSSKKK